MRSQFYPETEWSRRAVNRDATWAAVIRKVDGGWIAWESSDDYTTWCNHR